MNITKTTIILLATLAATGCTTVSKNIVGEEQEDVVPFAEATITFLGSETIDLRDSELVYLRMYVERDLPEVERLRNLLRQIDGFRDGAIDYSVELVRISESSGSETAQVQDLADTLQGRFRDRLLNQSDMTPGEFDAVIDSIRAQDTLLAALRRVQTLIVRSAENFEALIDEAQAEALPAAREAIDAEIEEEFATIIAQLNLIYGRRNEIMSGLQMIHAYQNGDKGALQGFKGTKIVLRDKYVLPGSPSDKQLDETKDYLIKELKKEDVILELLRKDVDDYLATRAELDREVAEVLNGLAVARSQIIGWTRAHQAMANGVREPGKWLEALMRVAQAARKY